MVQWNRRSHSCSEEDEQAASHLGTQTPAWHTAANSEIATQTAQQPIIEQATQTVQPVTQGTLTQTEVLLQAAITTATTATLTEASPRLCHIETVRRVPACMGIRQPDAWGHAAWSAWRGTGMHCAYTGAHSLLASIVVCDINRVCVGAPETRRSKLRPRDKHPARTPWPQKLRRRQNCRRCRRSSSSQDKHQQPLSAREPASRRRAEPAITSSSSQ